MFYIFFLFFLRCCSLAKKIRKKNQFCYWFSQLTTSLTFMNFFHRSIMTLWSWNQHNSSSTRWKKVFISFRSLFTFLFGTPNFIFCSLSACPRVVLSWGNSTLSIIKQVMWNSTPRLSTLESHEKCLTVEECSLQNCSNKQNI